MSKIVGQTLLNQYRVDAFLASGGIGAVYRVWDVKRNVSLVMKVLHNELADEPHIVNKNDSDLRPIDILLVTRVRSDWSPDGITIATYSGEDWHHEIFLFNFDGSDVRQTSDTGNVLACSVFPNEGWISRTGQIDNCGSDNGCKVYIMRTNSTNVCRFKNNDYCDWQLCWVMKK